MSSSNENAGAVSSASFVVKAPSRAHAGPGRTQQSLGAPLRGEHVALRPVTPDDYRRLFEFEVAGDNAAALRQRGRTPPFRRWVEEFESRNSLAEFLIVLTATGEPIGHVVAYGVSHSDRYCSLAAARFSTAESQPQLENGLSPMLWGIGMFIQYVFATWPIRRIGMEVPEFNYGQIAELEGFFEVEGILRDYSWFDGRYWDHKLLVLWRETWLGNDWIQQRANPPR